MTYIFSNWNFIPFGHFHHITQPPSCLQMSNCLIIVINVLFIDGLTQDPKKVPTLQLLNIMFSPFYIYGVTSRHYFFFFPCNLFVDEIKPFVPESFPLIEFCQLYPVVC